MEKQRLREFYSINHIEMWTSGEGVKNPKILHTSYLEAPLKCRQVHPHPCLLILDPWFDSSVPGTAIIFALGRAYLYALPS